MQVKLRFFGAARNVTGSRFLIEANGCKVLVDCGLYQERQFLGRNWERFPTPADEIDAVLLTHAHLDHCGLLPKLVREGFRGKIYCTPATAQIAQIVLLDSAHLQEEDAEFKRKRHEREGRRGPYPEVPLYTIADAEAVFPRFEYVRYGEARELAECIEATFWDAGHILGASMVKLRVGRDGDARTIIFSGDVGRWNMPILRDPTLFDHADYVLVESTYGDRVHHKVEHVKEKLARVINKTVEAGGNIVIPSFALERSQEVLYRLNELLIEDRIPHLMVFVDSPMAIRVTEVFEQHPELFDREMLEYIRQRESPFDFSGLKMTRTSSESKAINRIKGTVVIIAGWVMCTGGGIKQHLVNNITRPESTILFVGYQAEGTLGRHILSRPREVRILGRMLPVLAQVERVNGFSGHADRDELFRWASALKSPPRHCFVVHGEIGAAKSFSERLRNDLHWQVTVPEYKQEVTLD